MILGVYCINWSLSFYPVPYITEEITKWIVLIVGAFAVFESFKYFKGKKE